MSQTQQDVPQDEETAYIPTSQSEWSKMNYKLRNYIGKGADGIVYDAMTTAAGDLHQLPFIVKRRTHLRDMPDELRQMALLGEKFVYSEYQRRPSVFINAPMAIQPNKHGYDTLYPHIMDRTMLDVKGDLAIFQAEWRVQILDQILPPFASFAIRANNWFASAGWLHKDVKLANILVSYPSANTGPELFCNRIKLADFGHSMHLEPNQYCRNDSRGTDYCNPPEMKRTHPDICFIHFSSDVWSTGWMMYDLAGLKRSCLERPAQDAPTQNLVNRINQILPFLPLMIAPNPFNRISFKQLAASHDPCAGLTDQQVANKLCSSLTALTRLRSLWIDQERADPEPPRRESTAEVRRAWEERVKKPRQDLIAKFRAQSDERYECSETTFKDGDPISHGSFVGSTTVKLPLNIVALQEIRTLDEAALKRLYPNQQIKQQQQQQPPQPPQPQEPSKQPPQLPPKKPAQPPSQQQQQQQPKQPPQLPPKKPAQPPSQQQQQQQPKQQTLQGGALPTLFSHQTHAHQQPKATGAGNRQAQKPVVAQERQGLQLPTIGRSSQRKDQDPPIESVHSSHDSDEKSGSGSADEPELRQLGKDEVKELIDEHSLCGFIYGRWQKQKSTATKLDDEFEENYRMDPDQRDEELYQLRCKICDSLQVVIPLIHANQHRNNVEILDVVSEAIPKKKGDNERFYIQRQWILRLINKLRDLGFIERLDGVRGQKDASKREENEEEGEDEPKSTSRGSVTSSRRAKKALKAQDEDEQEDDEMSPTTHKQGDAGKTSKKHKGSKKKKDVAPDDEGVEQDAEAAPAGGKRKHEEDRKDKRKKKNKKRKGEENEEKAQEEHEAKVNEPDTAADGKKAKAKTKKTSGNK